jgi:zinc transporter
MSGSPAHPQALILDGEGGLRPCDAVQGDCWSVATDPVWVHLNYRNEADRQWLQRSSRLNPLVIGALLAEETRPRSNALDNGLLIALREVNLNPGADPDDMVAIRLWISGNRIVTARGRDLLSVADIREQLLAGRGPCGSGDFLVELTNQLVSRMSDTVNDLEERVAELETQILDSASSPQRQQLSNLRRQAITLRRYLAPQRDALARLMVEKADWLDEGNRLHLREVNDRLIRHIEDLDAVRERAAVAYEELISRLSEQLNNRMYVLSVVAAIFLPLGFFTGLLGVNIGGIPGTDNPRAFWEFVALMSVAVVAQIALFRWKRWL